MATELRFFNDGTHDALSAIRSLSPRAQAKTFALLDRMRATPRPSIRLKKTKQDELWESKFDLSPEGGLRVLFAFGKAGKVWCLGAFVKRDNNEGNKLLKHPYEKLAITASRL